MEVNYQCISTPSTDSFEQPHHFFHEISFSSPVHLSSVSFVNYFSSHITIWWRPYGEEGDGKRGPWRVALSKHRLMKCPHCEDDAHQSHSLSTSSWDADFDVSSVGGLRFYPCQSSALWRTYTIENICCYGPKNETAHTHSEKIPPPTSNSFTKSITTERALVQAIVEDVSLLNTEFKFLLSENNEDLDIFFSMNKLSDFTSDNGNLRMNC
ncbi:hypothetical protein P9112_003128 [Eukaryota sp. TZLM1-RC]